MLDRFLCAMSRLPHRQSDWLWSHAFELTLMRTAEWEDQFITQVSTYSINGFTRYMHAHQVPYAENMETSKWRSSKRWWRAVLRLSVHESASEVHRSGGDPQVISCLVVFHPFVEQLTVFHTSGLVLALSSIFRVLNLNLHAIVRWYPERHMPKGM